MLQEQLKETQELLQFEQRQQEVGTIVLEAATDSDIEEEEYIKKDVTKNNISDLDDVNDLNKNEAYNTSDDFLSVVDAINKELDTSKRYLDENIDKRFSKRERKNLIQVLITKLFFS